MSDEQKKTESNGIRLDGWLLIISAMIPVLISGLGSEEARKCAALFGMVLFHNADLGISILWASGLLIASVGAGVGAFKGWRSTQFADFRARQSGIPVGGPSAPGMTQFYTQLGAAPPVTPPDNKPG